MIGIAIGVLFAEIATAIEGVANAVFAFANAPVFDLRRKANGFLVDDLFTKNELGDRRCPQASIDEAAPAQPSDRQDRDDDKRTALKCTIGHRFPPRAMAEPTPAPRHRPQ